MGKESFLEESGVSVHRQGEEAVCEDEGCEGGSDLYDGERCVDERRPYVDCAEEACEGPGGYAFDDEACFDEVVWLDSV